MVGRITTTKKSDGQPEISFQITHVVNFLGKKVHTCNRFNYVIFHIHFNHGVI